MRHFPSLLLPTCPAEAGVEVKAAGGAQAAAESAKSVKSRPHPRLKGQRMTTPRSSWSSLRHDPPIRRANRRRTERRRDLTASLMLMTPHSATLSLTKPRDTASKRCKTTRRIPADCRVVGRLPRGFGAKQVEAFKQKVPNLRITESDIDNRRRLIAAKSKKSHADAQEERMSTARSIADTASSASSNITATTLDDANGLA